MYRPVLLMPNRLHVSPWVLGGGWASKERALALEAVCAIAWFAYAPERWGDGLPSPYPLPDGPARLAGAWLRDTRRTFEPQKNKQKLMVFIQ